MKNGESLQSSFLSIFNRKNAQLTYTFYSKLVQTKQQSHLHVQHAFCSALEFTPELSLTLEQVGSGPRLIILGEGVCVNELCQIQEQSHKSLLFINVIFFLWVSDSSLTILYNPVSFLCFYCKQIYNFGQKRHFEVCKHKNQLILNIANVFQFPHTLA